MTATQRDVRSAAAILGAKGGRARAAAMTPAQRSEAQRARVRARWVTRPVIAVQHDATTRMQVAHPWPCVGAATTWTEAIRLVRAAGYRVPSRRTPGWSWDEVPREILTREQAGSTWDEANDCGTVHAFGVPCWR